MKIYKFYAKSVGKNLSILPGQDVEVFLNRVPYKIRVSKNLKTFSYFELVFSAENNNSLIDIVGMDVEFIKPEAIKIVNDHNTKTQQEVKELNSEIIMNNRKISLYTIQDIIDRRLHYVVNLKLL